MTGVSVTASGEDITSPFPRPFDIVILSRYRPALRCGTVLRRLDPSLAIGWARDPESLDTLSRRLAPEAKLIGFSTSVIVPADHLPRFGGGAYNFHPGPPEYPGNHPSAFAHYRGAAQFGVTFHKMIEKVDAGEILDCVRFSATPFRTAPDLAAEAFTRLFGLFARNAPDLARRGYAPIPCGETWAGPKGTSAQAHRLRCLTEQIDSAELDRRIRSFLWVFSPVPEGRPRQSPSTNASSSSS